MLEIRTWCCRFLLWPSLLPCAWGVTREAFPPYPPEDFSSNCLPWLLLLLLLVHLQQSTSMTRAWWNRMLQSIWWRRVHLKCWWEAEEEQMWLLHVYFSKAFFSEHEMLSAVFSELLVGPFEYDESWLQNQFKVWGFLVLPRACVRSPGNPWDADLFWDACRRVSTSCKQ